MKLTMAPIYEAWARRPPRGGRGLKQFLMPAMAERLGSPPARGAWIETIWGIVSEIQLDVAPRAGGVD